MNTKPSLEPGTRGLVPLPATGPPRKPPCPHSHQATAPPPRAAGRLSVRVRDRGRALCECVPERERACERVLGGLRQGDTKGGGSATPQRSPPLFARRRVLKQNSGLRIKQNPPAQTSSQPLSICVPPATPPCWTSVSPSVDREDRGCPKSCGFTIGTREWVAGAEVSQAFESRGPRPRASWSVSPPCPPRCTPPTTPRAPCARLQERACVTQGLFIAELHQLQRHKQRGLSPYYYFNYHLN